jgi:hypothetical protein
MMIVILKRCYLQPISTYYYHYTLLLLLLLLLLCIYTVEYFKYGSMTSRNALIGGAFDMQQYKQSSYII